MPHYVIVTESDYEAAEARGDRWCLKCKTFCSADRCARCGKTESVTVDEARKRYLFFFAPDSPSER